jgi:hypothetical protein
MIKVIVSHDVDHLFGRDHWFRDMIYPKMWVRTTIQLVSGKIKPKEWFLRNTSCFRKNRHNIEALMKFDSEHGIKSTFFFGMKNGLGMSYKQAEAKPVISLCHDMGFPVGVHGIAFDNEDGIKREYDEFCTLMGFPPCGIRMHYVRFDDSTFKSESKAGYQFDSSEFDKKKGTVVKNPYLVGKMWEFPLTIMDGYLPQKMENAKERTLQILNECRKKNLEYVSVLFHDYQFCNDYLDMRDWYVWFMNYLSDSDQFKFCSYEEAIANLEAKQ